MASGKYPVQANGDGKTAVKEVSPGRSGGGDSGGGPYPNPHTGKKPKHGFMSHGGQTELDQKLTPGEPD